MEFEQLWTIVEYILLDSQHPAAASISGHTKMCAPKSGGAIFSGFHSFFGQQRLLSTKNSLYPQFHPCYPQFGLIRAELSIPKYGVLQTGGCR